MNPTPPPTNHGPLGVLGVSVVAFAIASASAVDAQAPPAQRVDVHFSAYGVTSFGGRIVVERSVGGTTIPEESFAADLPASVGGGARAGITVPYAHVLLQAEVSPVKPEGVRRQDRHRATSVSLVVAGRHRMRLRQDRFIEPYLGIGIGVALYDVESGIWSGRALQASLGLNVLFGQLGAFVEMGWQRFDLGGVPDDASILPLVTPGTSNTDIHFNRAQVRIGLFVEL